MKDSDQTSSAVLPYQAIAMAAAEILPPEIMRKIYERAHELVDPGCRGHQWVNAVCALDLLVSVRRVGR